MKIVNQNGVLRVINGDVILYTAQDSADADQFILTYIPVTVGSIDSSTVDFIPA